MNKEFYTRLAAVRENLGTPKNQHDSFGKYKYRSCEDILKGIKPLLNGLFLSISSEVVLIGGRYYVKATAAITDGENGYTVTVFTWEEESKRGMDSVRVTGATSSYAYKYCPNGLFGIDGAKDTDTDEHKHQQNAAAKQSKPSPTPKQVLETLTDTATRKSTVEELKQVFAEAWKVLEDAPEQQEAQGIYNTKRDELEGVAA